MAQFVILVGQSRQEFLSEAGALLLEHAVHLVAEFSKMQVEQSVMILEQVSHDSLSNAGN